MFKLLLPLILAVSAIAQNAVTLTLERPGGTGLLGTVATPTASPSAGQVSGGTSVTFSTSTSGATLRYTSGNGTQAAPTCSSGTLGSSVTVSADTTYKVIGCKTAYADSAVATFAYTLPAETAFVTNQTLGSTRNDVAGCVGMQFTVGASDVTVTKLGRWIVSGNSASHTLRLFSVSAGNGTSVGTVTVNSSGATSGQYLYGTLGSPVTLTAGGTYVLLSDETSGGDNWYDAGSVTTTSVATVSTAAFVSGSCSGVVAVSTFSAGSNSYGPVSFKY